MLASSHKGLQADQILALPDSAFRLTGERLLPDANGERWLRLCLNRSDAARADWVLTVNPATVGRVTLYRQTPDGLAASPQGAELPMSARDINYRSFAFNIAPPAGDAGEVLLLHVKASPDTIVHVRLYQDAGFAHAMSLEYGLFGVYLGMVLLAITINTMFWLWLRDPIYLQYASAMVAVSLFSVLADGYVAQLVLPESPQWVTLLRPIAYSLCAILLTVFSISAFRLRQCYPWVYRITQVILGGYVLLLVLHVLAVNAPLDLFARFLFLLHIPLITAVSLHALFRHPSIRLYSVALLPLEVVLLLFPLALITTTPLNIPGLQYLPNLSAMVHLVLLNAALAQRAWRAERGRLEAQAQALGAARRVEHELEKRVAERTRALDVSNRDLHHEIQERRAAETQLTAALEKERTATLTQRQFLSMVSHEFRTPLTIIDAAAQALALTSTLAQRPDAISRIARIRRAVTRLLTLIEQFLIDDKLSTRSVILQKRIVDIGDQLHRRFGDERGDTRLSVALPDEPVEVDIDAQLIDIALSNLVDNALKYSPADQPVMLRLSVSGAWADIEVRDQGAGVSDEDRPHIFNKYFRSTSAQAKPGGGLGLYLCKELIERQGGTVELLPTMPDGGASFRVRLPLAASGQRFTASPAAH